MYFEPTHNQGLKYILYIIIFLVLQAGIQVSESGKKQLQSTGQVLHYINLLKHVLGFTITSLTYIFSFGHLSFFVCTQMFPCCLLASTYVANCIETVRRDQTLGHSEVEKQREYFHMLCDNQYHPLRALMK